MSYHLFSRVGALALMVSLAVAGLGRVEAETIIAWDDAGHSSSGTWFNGGTNINEKLSSPNAGATSTWDFTGLANGTYYVSTDWTTYSNRTSSARYEFTDGLGDVVVDQQSTARDFYELVGGVPVGWMNLGQVTVSDGDLNVMLSDDDANGGGWLMADAIRISTTPGVNTLPGVFQGTVVDVGDPTHTFTGSWSTTTPGYGEYYQFAAGSSASTAVSEWTITGLTPLVPTDVSTTWFEFGNRGTNVPYTISGIVGGDQTIEVNQQDAPNPDAYAADLTAKAYPFQSLGTFTPTGTSITVTMSNFSTGLPAENYAVADAVRAQQVPEPSTAMLLVLGGLFSLLRFRGNEQK